MLVLSMDCGGSIIVVGPDGGCLFTALGVGVNEIQLLVTTTSTPGGFDAWTTSLARNASVRVGRLVEATLIDIRNGVVRLGVVASKTCSVHRLEVWEAIRRETRRPPDDEDDGSAASRVPRPGGPRPPSLDVRLTPPGDS